MAKGKYSVVEIFPTYQGEGLWTGRRAIFLRLAGCNQWDGIPAHRTRGSGACAMWCDTNFVKGKPHELPEILDKLAISWGMKSPRGKDEDRPMVVITGGEPCLQLDKELAQGITKAGYYLSIETNGTINNPALNFVDHVCVSPKRGSELKVWSATELKVVVPGCVPGAPLEHQWSLDDLRQLAHVGHWEHMFIQPQDVTDPNAVEVTHLHQIRRGLLPGEVPSAAVLFASHMAACYAAIEALPGWRLSYQTHKAIGLR